MPLVVMVSEPPVGVGTVDVADVELVGVVVVALAGGVVVVELAGGVVVVELAGGAVVVELAGGVVVVELAGGVVVGAAVVVLVGVVVVELAGGVVAGGVADVVGGVVADVVFAPGATSLPHVPNPLLQLSPQKSSPLPHQ